MSSQPKPYNNNPALYWRDMLFHDSDRHRVYAGEDRHSYLLQEGEEFYNSAKEEMKKLGEQYRDRRRKEFRDRKEMCSTQILATSVILLTFGRLEVVEDILLYAPLAPCNLSTYYLAILRSLFPLPYDLKLLGRENWAKIGAWVLNNKEHLTWSEEAGCFVSTSP